MLRFEQVKKLWEDRDTVIIEGEKSRLGVNNDLFSKAKSIKRILAPARDAFSKYDEILQEAQKISKDCLLLIALGPTATVLARDLALLGYQAIDIGHIDTEYEWCKINAEEKVAIPNKYTNEATNKSDVGEETDLTYQEQIIAKIL